MTPLWKVGVTTHSLGSRPTLGVTTLEAALGPHPHHRVGRDPSGGGDPPVELPLDQDRIVGWTTYGSLAGRVEGRGREGHRGGVSGRRRRQRRSRQRRRGRHRVARVRRRAPHGRRRTAGEESAQFGGRRRRLTAGADAEGHALPMPVARKSI